MGGTTEPILTQLKATYKPGLSLDDALKVAIGALLAGQPEADKDKRPLGEASLEVATLEQQRPRRAFRRLQGPALEAALAASKSKPKPVKEAKLPEPDDDAGK